MTPDRALGPFPDEIEHYVARVAAIPTRPKPIEFDGFRPEETMIEPWKRHGMNERDWLHNVIATESRDSLYGLNHVTLALLKDRTIDGHRLVQIMVNDTFVTIGLADVRSIVSTLVEAAEAERLTEHLALRSIVEVVAASDPWDDDFGGCVHCGSVKLGIHSEDCPYARAVALVGAPNGPDGGGVE